MAPAAGFTNSTGVDYSPPSPVDYSSGSDRQSYRAKHDDKSPVYAYSPASPVKRARPNDATPALKKLKKPPPTAPRSMRQNISPPPLRRADTIRDHGPRRPDQYEAGRPSRRRYSDEFRRFEKARASDSYIPLSPRRRDAAREDSRTPSSPRDDRHGRPAETGRRRRSSILDNHADRPKIGTGEAISLDGAGKASGSKSVVGVNNEALFTARKAARLIADKINQQVDPATKLDARGIRLDQRRKSDQDEHVQEDDEVDDHEEGEYVESETTKAGTQHGLALPQPEMRLNIPSHHEAYEPHLNSLADRHPLPIPAVLNGTSFNQGNKLVESIEYESQPRPPSGSFHLKPHPKEMTLPSREDFWSNKFEGASTPSTGTTDSRNRNICRACRKPGSTITQLVPCARCSKGYHDCCGNPKPRQSERLEDFVCGRCLKKQEAAAAAAQHESERTSVDRYSPSDTLPTLHSRTVPIKPPIHAPVVNPVLPTTNSGADDRGGSARSSVDRYSPTDELVLNNLSLPLQSQTAAPLEISSLPETHLTLTAKHNKLHNSLNTAANRMGQTPSSEVLESATVPNGQLGITTIPSIIPEGPKALLAYSTNPPITPQKPYTRDLSQTEKSAIFSQTASQSDRYKLITCPSLRRGGCWLIEEHCVFAHRETGLAAPNSYPGAKDFTCPDFRAERCPWLSEECKYAHTDTGFYIGMDGKASLKHITCWYWKIRGHCIKTEASCLYAHQETGLLSWQPGTDMNKHGVGENSLKAFICPRFEDRQYCEFYLRGTCPYDHSWSGKSCLAQYRLEHFGVRRLNGLDGQTSPPGSPTALGKISLERTAQTLITAPTEPAENPSKGPTLADEVQSAVNQPQQELQHASSTPSKTPSPKPQTSIRQGGKKEELREVQELMAYPKDEQEAVNYDPNQAETLPDTTQAGSQATTEQPLGRVRGSRVARRGGLGLRPTLGRILSTTASVKKTETSERDFPVYQEPSPVADPNSLYLTVSPSKDTAASSGSIERKKCEGCPKTIYSSGARCQTCVKKQEDQQSVEKAQANILVAEPLKSLTPLSIETPDDLLGSPQLEALTLEQGSFTLGGRKRPAKDGHLFVAAKRRRMSQTARDAAIAVLRQERRDAPSGVTVEINLKGPSTLENLTNLAIQERISSGRNSTEETMAKTPSTRQNSADILPNQIDGGSPLKAVPIAPSALSLEIGTYPAVEPPAQMLGKRARRSSSIDSVLKPSFQDDATTPTMVTRADAESRAINKQVQPVPIQDGSEHLEAHKDNFAPDEHETLLDSNIRHPKKAGKIGHPLLERADHECVRPSITTKSRFNDQDTLEKATKQNSVERIIARKSASVPAVHLQTKRTTTSSDDSASEDADEESDRDAPLAKAVGQTRTTSGAPINKSLEATPISTEKEVAATHLCSQAQLSGVNETPNSGQTINRSQLNPRCPRCKDTHKRCWHKTDGSPDPMKCEMLVQDYGPQGPAWFKPYDWKKVLEGANQAMLDKFAAKNGNNKITGRKEQVKNTTNILTDSEDELAREDTPSPTPLMQNTAEEEDDEEDLRPLAEIRFLSSTSGRGPISAKETPPKPAAEKSNGTPLAVSNKVLQAKETSRPSISPLTTIADSRDASRTATEGEQLAYSKEEDAQALQSLKQAHPGIMFDSESEDEEMEDDGFEEPPPTWIDPLQQRPIRSRNLFDIDPTYDMSDSANRLAAAGILPSSTRPTKKQIMGGKLLHCQVAERRKRFGNPHQEVRRYPKDSMVTTTVQRDIDFDNSQGVRAKTEKVAMTFREFLGAPKDPVIEARKDQLVFREKEQVQQIAGRHGRARRVMESEVFPFVY